MTYKMKPLNATSMLALTGSLVLAKMLAPSNKVKAKASDTAVKSIWIGKVDSFKLCKQQEVVVANYKKISVPKEVEPPANRPAAATPARGVYVDPGSFVRTPLVAVTTCTASAGPEDVPASSAASQAKLS